MTERAIRICLDINVLLADLPGTITGRKSTASRYLVDAGRKGECDAGPVQLITSVPVIENCATVLIRRFNFDRDSAEKTAWLLQDYTLEGPLAVPPSIMVEPIMFLLRPRRKSLRRLRLIWMRPMRSSLMRSRTTW